METTGKFSGMSLDVKSRKPIVSFTLDTADMEELQRISEAGKLSIKAVKYSEKRSLSANAYFHVLVREIASVLRSSNTEVKNHLIREYGAFEFIDDHIPTFKLKAEYEVAMLNREDIHVKPIGREYENGCEWVRFAFMRGSHTYSTAEMSRLIDGTVQEAKELGIETLPPAELERMIGSWKTQSS